MKSKTLLFIALLVLVLTACNKDSTGVSREWSRIEDSAMGTTVNLYTWDGNKSANAWFDSYLKPKVLEKYNITLNRFSLSYKEIFQILESDKVNENDMGEIDLIWISGENFKYAYDNEYLFGPFVDKLPNYTKYLNGKDPEVEYDLFNPTNGYEAPLGKSQFVMFYNEDLLYEPPKSYEEFKNVIKENPGMFTYPAPPDVNGSAFVRSIIYQYVEYKELLNLKNDKVALKKLINPALEDLKELKPYLWKKGEEYPANATELDQLFFVGDVLMSMNYDHNHGTDKIADFEYPNGTKPLLFDNTVGRTHYLAIAYNSVNKSGAMTVINYCLSADAQGNKFRVQSWGDIPVLERGMLTADEIRSLKKAVTKKTSPQLDDLLDNRVPEMSTSIANMINAIWLEEIGKLE